MSKFKQRAAEIGGFLHARASAESSVQDLPLDDVLPDPENPRVDFDADELAKLAKSIARRGVLQPITVRSPNADGKYVIRFGERRWRASQIAGKPSIRAIVSDTANETDNLVEQVIENEQRADLRTSEMVAAVQRLLAGGLSKAEVAEELSCKPAEITQYAAIPQMAEYLRELVDQWPRRALYDLHVAARQHGPDVERFVATRREQGVTTAAVASFVRGLKEPGQGRVPAPVAEPLASQPAPRADAEASGGAEATPAPVKAKGRRKKAPESPAVSVTVDGRSGRLILPETVSVLFEGEADPVIVPASELRFSDASA